MRGEIYAKNEDSRIIVEFLTKNREKDVEFESEEKYKVVLDATIKTTGSLLNMMDKLSKMLEFYALTVANKYDPDSNKLCKNINEGKIVIREIEENLNVIMDYTDCDGEILSSNELVMINFYLIFSAEIYMKIYEIIMDLVNKEPVENNVSEACNDNMTRLSTIINLIKEQQVLSKEIKEIQELIMTKPE